MDHLREHLCIPGSGNNAVLVAGLKPLEEAELPEENHVRSSDGLTVRSKIVMLTNHTARYRFIPPLPTTLFDMLMSSS